MTNKFAGGGLLVTIVLAMVGGVAEAGDTFFAVVGIGIFIFGLVAGYRLWKIEDAK